MNGTLDAALAAVQHFRELDSTERRQAEIIVVDNQSTDGTPEVLARYSRFHGVHHVRLPDLGAARARNFGRRIARGRVLVFVDADTHVPRDAITKIVDLCERDQKSAGITRLAALDGHWRAHCWWTFWGFVRSLPIPRAKAMPALMFCTSAAFDEFGPFDERVAIGEEWPILAGLYRRRPDRFVYDRSIIALTSSRRMERQAFGYLRTLLKYLWAILDVRGRIHYSDQIR